MAHNEPMVLLWLLKCLDDERNDIFLHLDINFQNTIDHDLIKKNVNSSSIFFLKSHEVNWGGYSQVKVTFELLKMSSRTNEYSYYHFISGVDLPLKSQNQLHSFFSEQYDQEFISFGKIRNWKISRRYRHYYSESLVNFFGRKTLRYFNYVIGFAQKVLRVEKKFPKDFEFHMGGNWFSITNHAVKILLAKEKLIEKYFKHGFLIDEVAFNSILMNSERKGKVSTMQNLRYVDWNRGNPYVWSIDDYKELTTSNVFFARKFSYERDKNVVEKIGTEIHGIKEFPQPL